MTRCFGRWMAAALLAVLWGAAPVLAQTPAPAPAAAAKK